MESSLFIQYVEKYFKAIVGKVTEKINGKKEEEQLLHKTMLTEEYSADLNWGATEISSSVVSADVVSTDTSLPLKKRDSFSSAIGTLPKLGLKFRKGEKDISGINIMMARGTGEATIAGKLFDDVVKVVKGVDIAKEIMFLQGLSTGVALAPGATDDKGVRVSYGYKVENSFKADIAWGGAGYTPLDDLQKMFDKADADGNTISIIMLSKKYFDFMRKSDQAKFLSANFQNNVITDKSLLPIPLKTNLLDALSDEYGAEFRVVNSSFKIEDKAGKQTSIKPWAEANIIGIPSDKVGRLVYGTLAEESNPVANVNYSKSGSHLLVSKYSKTDPLEEFTSGQAIVLPVIDGADSIYMLEANEVEVVPANDPITSLSADNGLITVYDRSFAKVDVIAAVKSAGVSCASNILDATLIGKIQDFTTEQEFDFRTALGITE
jgi:hypothetical protein